MNFQMALLGGLTTNSAKEKVKVYKVSCSATNVCQLPIGTMPEMHG